MQYSIVNLSEIKQNSDLRIDAEYWKPEYINGSILIDKKDNARLYELSEIKGGKRLPLGETFSATGVPYIRAEDIKNNFVDYGNSPCISEKLHHILRNYQTKKDDVLLTIVGNSIGNIGIVKFNSDKCNLTENACKIVSLNRINPEFLFVFMLSKFGQSYIEREKVGSAQPKLSLTRIRDFVIPIPSVAFQSKIADLVNSSYTLRQSADALYKEAEDILLEELDLKNYQPQNKKCFVKMLSDTKNAGRVDAEYFQPKYENVVKKIKNYGNGHCCLEDGDIRDKNFSPKKEESYKYIELANISSNSSIDGVENMMGSDLPTRARRIVKTNDLIVSSVEGSLNSIALINDNLSGALCSTGFFVINCDRINSESLLVFLKSEFGQMQLKKGCSGTILSAIGKDELKNIVIPLIPLSIQSSISSKIQSSFSAREKSKQLLEVAKMAVEIAIEEGENAGLGYIEKNVDVK